MTKFPPPAATLLMIFFVGLRAKTSTKARRTFYRNMRQEMFKHGLVMAAGESLCLVLCSRDGDPLTDRNAVVSWLIDQPECQMVCPQGWISLEKILDGDYPVVLDGDKPEFDDVSARLRRLYRRLLTGVLVQALHRRRYREGA